MDSEKNRRLERALYIYTKLMDGYVLNRSELAVRFDVNERTILRDIDDIRNFLDDAEETGIINSIIYDRDRKGYRLEKIYRMKFTNAEILAICKILLDSRAFTKKEMTDMLAKLIDGCVPKSNQKLVSDLVKNEEFHYVEPRHKTAFIDTMWEIGQAIRNCHVIEVDYEKLKGKQSVTRRLLPVAIMFSEYYFYLTAFIDDESVKEDFDVINDSFPTIYRIDRIKSLRVQKERIHIPYASRFEEGEFRKRIQFMFGGKLRKLKFKYTGLSIESVLDRLPTAKIISKEDGAYIVEAEVFGDGVDMWLRGQGDVIEML